MANEKVYVDKEGAQELYRRIKKLIPTEVPGNGKLKVQLGNSQVADTGFTANTDDDHTLVIGSASTSAQGIVQLSNAIDSSSETNAATSKAVKDAYDALDAKMKARAVFFGSVAEWNTYKAEHPEGDPSKVYYVQTGSGEDKYTVYVWKVVPDGVSVYEETDESSISLDGYWYGSPSVVDDPSSTDTFVSGIALNQNGTVSVTRKPVQNVKSDWNAAAGSAAEILNKPSIPASQVNADWNASSGVEEIINKPSVDSTLREYTDSQDNKLWGVQNPLPASIGNTGDVLTVDNGAPVWMPPAPQGQVMVIFLDYNLGNDSNDGLTPLAQVQTLTKAISILMQHKNSVIYIKNGGSYNLNGAEVAHILSMDSEDHYTILNADLNIYCDTYLNLTFSDATSSIDVVKLQGDVKVHAKGVLRLSRVDISGDHLDLTSETSIYIEDNGSGNMPLPVFKSKYINVNSNGIISMQYVNIQSDKTTAEVKFHTVKGNIDLRYSSITACHLSLTGDNTGYKSGYGVEIYTGHSGNAGIDLYGDMVVVCRDFNGYNNNGNGASIKCDKLYIKGHYITTPSTTVEGDFIVDSDYMVNVYGDIWSKNGNICINADSSFISFSMIGYRALNTNRYLKANGIIKLTGGFIQGSGGGTDTLGWESKILYIRTYDNNSESIPDVYAAKVIIHANQDLSINSITPTSSYNNGIVDIKCEVLKFEKSSKKIGVNSSEYFKSVSINASTLYLNANAITAYSVDITTTGLRSNTTYGDLFMEYNGQISAMYLNLNVGRMYVSSGSKICIGGNNLVNSAISGLDWSTTDIQSSTKYSRVTAKSIWMGSPIDSIIYLCPAQNKNAGQYLNIDIGVLDLSGMTLVAGGNYCKMITFCSYGGSSVRIPFNGNISGNIGGIFGGTNNIRPYVWDNSQILFFNSSPSVSSGTSTLPLDGSGNIIDTGTVTATVSYDRTAEFYIAADNSSPTSLDLNTGLSPETAVQTFKGLLRALSRFTKDAYMVKIHLLTSGGSTTFDLSKIKNLLTNTTFLEIEGSADVNLTINSSSGPGVLSVHDFYTLTYNDNNTADSGNIAHVGGQIYINDVRENLNIYGNNATCTYYILYASSLGAISIKNISASRMTVNAPLVGYNNVHYNGHESLNFYGDQVQFNKTESLTGITDPQEIGSLTIDACNVSADLTKFPVKNTSIRLNGKDGGYDNTTPKNCAVDVVIDGRIGFYKDTGISAIASSNVGITVKNSSKSALSSNLGTNGLSVEANNIELYGECPSGASAFLAVLPYFHCNLMAKEKIINHCDNFTIGYGSNYSEDDFGGYEEHSNISAAVLAYGTMDTTEVSRRPCVLTLNSGDYNINIGTVDIDIILGSRYIYDAVNDVRNLNAYIHVDKISKNCTLKGYCPDDGSQVLATTKFNVVASLGIVDKSATWYTYFDDGTGSAADNDPAKSANFKFIAHVLHEGSSSVTQSYTGANTLWQVVADDKPRMTLPPAPSGNGSYILTCTMTNGTPTYSWITMNTTTVP